MNILRVVELAKRLTEGEVVLSKSILQLKGRYQLIESLGVSEGEDGYIYYVRYSGSPYDSENESIESREYPTRLKAAIAAIKEHKIMGISPNDVAIFAPKKQGGCLKCEYYSHNANFCAVNPSNLGRSKKCPDFSYRVQSPKLAPKLGVIGKALQLVGVVS